MPIYEYRCSDCRRKTQVLTLSVKSAVEPKCRHCGGANLVKLVSRVAFLRSEASRLESMADPSSLAGLDENDPKSVARWMKKMGKEMGEEAGEEFDDEIDRAVEEMEQGGGDEGGVEGPGGDEEGD
jgi:putative FmdB family regulatory protein